MSFDCVSSCSRHLRQYARLIAGAELIPETWRFKATPYLWALSVDGNTTVKGQKSDVDMSFSDIVDKLNFGLFGA